MFHVKWIPKTTVREKPADEFFYSVTEHPAGTRKRDGATPVFATARFPSRNLPVVRRILSFNTIRAARLLTGCQQGSPRLAEFAGVIN
jgi:hypothetical protein